MSSFTINKRDYVKVAGLIAGIADGVDRGIHHFWVFDYKEGRNSDKEIYYKRFCQCYEMNAAAVKEQYHGAEVGAPATDTNEYRTDFNRYYKIGYRILCESPEVQRQTVKDIQMFFSSVLYQTENDKYNFMMRHWFGVILEQLIERVLLSGYESECWGSFELFYQDNKKKETA